MVLGKELVAGPNIVVEQAAVIHDAGQQIDLMLDGRRQDQPARPRFED